LLAALGERRLPDEEIAGILGCATGTVRVQLFQARKKLKIDGEGE
jgi:DNA-directed RNA polymerase specialized sigma24 family protein